MVWEEGGGGGDVTRCINREILSGPDGREAFPREEDLNWDMSAEWKLSRPSGLWEKTVSRRQNRALKWGVIQMGASRRQCLEEKPALGISMKLIIRVNDKVLDELM